MEKPQGYIPKSDMQDGACYLSICRNNYVAEWDAKQELFVYIRYKFGHMLDTIKHFEDVIDEGVDGFVPIEKLINPKIHHWSRDFQNEIGY